MFLTWYEKIVDDKDNLYLKKWYFEKLNEKRTIPHFHDSIEMIFVTKGSFGITVGNKTHEITAGEICFVDSFEKHSFRNEIGVECYVLLISRSFFSDANHLPYISFPTFMPKNENFGRIIEFLDYTLSVWDSESLVLKTGFVNYLMYFMTKYYETLDKKDIERKNEIVIDVISYIFSHSSENITIDSVAKELGYNKNYLSSLLNRVTGLSFRDHLNSRRLLNYLRIRWKNKERNVKDIAYEVGFESMNTFYRAYKKYVLP